MRCLKLQDGGPCGSLTIEASDSGYCVMHKSTIYHQGPGYTRRWSPKWFAHLAQVSRTPAFGSQIHRCPKCNLNPSPCSLSLCRIFRRLLLQFSLMNSANALTLHPLRTRILGWKTMFPVLSMLGASARCFRALLLLLLACGAGASLRAATNSVVTVNADKA